MDLYEVIYKRKSVRKYSDKKVSKDTLRNIEKSIEQAERFSDGIEIDVKILDHETLSSAITGVIGSYGKVEAPYYITASSEEKGRYLENIGYTLEPAVLRLTAKKLGTCWVGGGFKGEELESLLGLEENMKPVILIAFGHPAEGKSAWRDNKTEAKRKKLSELVLGDVKHISKRWKKILNAARMAPSAVNSQPWRFKKEENALHTFISIKGGLLNRAMKMLGNLGEMNHIDAGIAMRHIKIAADKLSKSVELKRIEDIKEKDHEYIASFKEKS